VYYLKTGIITCHAPEPQPQGHGSKGQQGRDGGYLKSCFLIIVKIRYNITNISTITNPFILKGFSLGLYIFSTYKYCLDLVKKVEKSS
jgi:hypothetical protein